MEPQYVEGAIQGLVWLGLIFVVAYGPWQKICIDYARDAIFEQRDIVFDMAANGKLEFGSQPYEKVRSAMNALIRMAHCLTLPRLVVSTAYARITDAPRRRNEARAALELIEDLQTRQEVAEALDRAERAAINLIAMRSPFLVVIAAIAKLFGKFAKLRGTVEPLVIGPLESAMGHESTSFQA